MYMYVLLYIYTLLLARTVTRAAPISQSGYVPDPCLNPIVVSTMSTDSTIKEEHRRLFEEGLKVRAAVIGSDYVDRSLKSATSFTWPGQELVTESVWGNIWTRPGLDLKQRSLISE